MVCLWICAVSVLRRFFLSNTPLLFANVPRFGKTHFVFTTKVPQSLHLFHISHSLTYIIVYTVSFFTFLILIVYGTVYVQGGRVSAFVDALGLSQYMVIWSFIMYISQLFFIS